MARFSIRSFCKRSYPLIRQLYPCEVKPSVIPLQCTKGKFVRYSTVQPYSVTIKCYSNTACNNDDVPNIENKPPEKKSLLKRFKEMYRDYWYVLVPVHLVTSAGWFGSFYYLAKSGVDIVGILENWNISETITNSLKDSSMGYLAIAYALYKLATPVRYTVTLGGTTLSINYLKKWGCIKPFGGDQLKEMYKKKENIMGSINEKRSSYKKKRSCSKTKRNNDPKQMFFTGLQEIKNAKFNVKPKIIEIQKKQE